MNWFFQISYDLFKIIPMIDNFDILFIKWSWILFIFMVISMKYNKRGV